MRVIRQLIEHLDGRRRLSVEQVENLRRMGLIETSADFEMPLDDLELTVRAYNLLVFGGVRSVSQLIALTEDDVREFRNMSEKALGDIKNKLSLVGLSLRECHPPLPDVDDDDVVDGWDARGDRLIAKSRRRRHSRSRRARRRQ